MEELQSPTKLTNVKKVTPPPVESTINQRPRRKIKHKFIKCNRESLETVTDAEANVEDVVVAVAAKTELDDLSDATTSQATKPKIKNHQKLTTKKNVRLSGRQNRSKDSVSDIDDSNLQMVEIIDDPSDDPNVSIEEIIETCVLDAEEYQRMVTCSKQVCNDSSSNTTTSVTDLSDVSFIISTDKTNFNSQCIQNSCERQISVGLVDCMKNKNIVKHLALDERKMDDKNKSHTFEGVFNKSSDDVQEKVDIKPTTEFCSPIRTRRVTRLSTMSAHRSLLTQLSLPKPLSPKIKIEGVQLENFNILEDTTTATKTESSSDINKCENEDEILASSAHPQTLKIEQSDMSNEITKDTETAEGHKDLTVISGDELKVEALENSGEIKLDNSQSEKDADDDLKSKTIATEPVKISQESGCNNWLTNDNKTKERTKLKKERKRNSQKQDRSLSIGEEKSQLSSNKSQTASENQSTEQNKTDFITFMEKKFQDSDPSKQMQRTIADDGDCSVQNQETLGDIVKIEKSKKKKDSHSDKDNKSKRSSDAGKKSEKSFDSQSTHKSSSSKSSSTSDKKSKDSKLAEPKVKHHSSEQDLQTKKSHKRDNSCNRSEKEIAMEQLKAIEQKTANRNKPTSLSHKDPSEKARDASVKSKTKPTPEITKVKSKTKEIVSNDPKDDKAPNSKNLLDQGSSNRKSQQQATSANRPSKSNRSGTDFILSECYLPKQVKYDESLYSIEALKAAQAAQEEQIKADAEAAKKAKEILAAKEEQAKAARAAARLAKIEEAKALEKTKAEAEKAAKLAKAAAKAARSKQLKESSSRSNGNLNFL